MNAWECQMGGGSQRWTMYMTAYLCLPKQVSIYNMHLYHYKLDSLQCILWTKCLCLSLCIPNPNLYVEALIPSVSVFADRAFKEVTQVK